MSFKDLVLYTRSYRRFDGSVPVLLETLRELVDLARQTASGSNIQPLKYILSTDPETNARIFPLTAWAGYLADWPGPVEGERPTAYVLVLCDTEFRQQSDIDLGIAAQTIMLGAAEKGLGGCMLGSIDREKLRALFSIPERYKIVLCLALGKAVETVVLEPVGSDGNIRYYRDADGVHHVPKRSLDEIVVAQFG